MNSQELPPQEAAVPTAAPTTVSPGALIREARKATGISVDDLATLTKLARPTVEALERDDFSALLEPVYARGYYRKCAKVLNIDEKALIDGYNQRVIPKSPLPPAKLRLASGSDLGTGGGLPVPTAIVVAVIAVIACALLWFLRGVGGTPSVPVSSNVQPTVVGEAPPASSVPVATTIAPAGDAGNAEVKPAGPAAPAATVASPEAAAVPPPSASATPSTVSAPAAAAPALTPTSASATPAASAPVAAAGDGPLLVKFNARSWLRIKDADGTMLVRAELAAGTVRRFDGKQPFDIFVGDASAVSVEYRGQVIDLAPHTRLNKTAWLQLPAKTGE